MYSDPRKNSLVVEFVSQLVRRWRLELAIFIWFCVVGSILSWVLGESAATILQLLLIVGCVVHPAPRSWYRERRRKGAICRRLEDAFRYGRLEPFMARPPKVVSMTEILAGTRLELRLQVGSSIDQLAKCAPQLSAAMHVREARLIRDPVDAGRVWLTLVSRDPFDGPPVTWPSASWRACNFSDPIHLGIDPNGRLIETALVEHHLLVGGEPGSGKSNALSLVVAAAALDRNVRLHLLDGKLVELAPWRGCATSFVGPDLEEAIELIEQLRSEMDRRYALLAEQGKRKVTVGSDLGFEVVVCDELALYFNRSDKKAVARFTDGFRDLVARGRAAGVIVVGATQKPSTDVVPSSIRDLFGYRWAMRCSTREASDTILGSGWASLGFSSADIDPATRGVGYLLHEGGSPERVRAFHLDDDQIAMLARLGAELRAAVPSVSES